MTYKPFDIVAVPFPFTDHSATRRRPAVVLSSATFNQTHDQLILAMVTLAANSSWDSDVRLEEPEVAGLKPGSIVRMKLFTLDRELVIRTVGRLSDGDMARVGKMARGVMG